MKILHKKSLNFYHTFNKNFIIKIYQLKTKFNLNPKVISLSLQIRPSSSYLQPFEEKTYFYEQRLGEYEHMIENLEDQLKSYDKRLEISENEIKKLENLNKKAYINNNKLQNIVNMLENRENDYKRQISQYRSETTQLIESDQNNRPPQRNRRTTHSFHMFDNINFHKEIDDKSQVLIKRMEAQIKYLQSQIDKKQVNEDYLTKKLDCLEKIGEGELSRLKKLETTILTIVNAGDEEELLRILMEYKNYQSLTSKFLNSLAGILQKIFPEAKNKPNLKEMWNLLKLIFKNYNLQSKEEADTLQMIKKLIEIYDNAGVDRLPCELSSGERDSERNFGKDQKGAGSRV